MKKQTGILTTLAALGLAAAIPAALAWFYDVFVHWQPNLYPLAVVAAILGAILLTLLTLWARGERKALPLVWKTALSAAVFVAALVGVSGVINNGIYQGRTPGPTIAAGVVLPLCAAQILVLFALLLRKLRKPAVAVCLAASFLLSITMIAVPWYIQERYKAPIPALPQGRFAPMPELGEVDFTVPIDGSIEEVRDLIREARTNGEDKRFTVLIEDGEYSITQIAFDERDRDTTYRSRDGGVILNGGVSLNPADFETPDDTVLERLSAKAKRSVRVIDLTAMGLTAEDWGKLHAFGAYNTAYKYDGADGPLPCELFYNGKRCTTARYPNGGKWLKIGRVLDNGDSLETYEGGGKQIIDGWDQLRNPRGGTFAMDKKTAARAAGWTNPNDAWIFGFFKFDWADMSTPVKAIDSAAGTLTTGHASVWGFEEGRTYYFFNVLEELDEPGEWYLDRDAGLLYLWPPDGGFGNARIDISLSTEILIRGADLDGLRFMGLTLQGTRGTALALSGDNLTVSHCLVQNVASTGIALTGYNNTASDNTVRHVGGEGISIDGGDMETLTPGNSKAVNNLVHDWSEVVMTYRGGVRVNGIGNLAAHNEIYNSPHTAIFFGGNNHVIEHNLIYGVCLETDDAGAIYNGRSWYSAQGTVIRNNVICNIGNGGGYRPKWPVGIYLDDGLSGVTVENNLLVNVPGRVIALGGRDLTVRGNVVVNGGRPINYDDGLLQLALEGRENSLSSGDGSMWTKLEASPRQTDIWREAFPKLAAYSTDFADIEEPSFAANPAGSVVAGNIFVGPNPPFFSEAALRFSEIGPNEEYGVLRTRSYWNLPGFEAIEVEKAGRIAAYD